MDLRRVKLRHLHCLVEVARTNSMEEAAIALKVSPSAVSKTLRELEDVVGVRLFNSSRRGSFPTDEGEQLVGRINLVLSGMRSGFEQLNGDVSGNARELRIGALPIFAAHVLPRWIQSYVDCYPDVRLEVMSGVKEHLLTKLRSGEIEILFGRLPAPNELQDLVFEQLFVDRYIFVIRPGHPLAGVHEQEARVFNGSYHILLPTQGTSTWHEINRVFRARGTGLPRRRIETTDLQLSRNLTLSSDAVWIASRISVAADLASGALRELAVNTDLLEAPMGVISTSDRRREGPAEDLLALARRSPFT